VASILYNLTYHAQAQNHTAPEEHIVEQCTASDPLASLDHDNRHLQHHSEEPIASELPCDAAHNQLMCKCRDKESDSRCDWTRHVVLRCRVDVTTEEVMNRLVPAEEAVSISPKIWRMKENDV
jgi:hypothetical protein